MSQLTRKVTSTAGIEPALSWVKENITRGIQAGPLLIVLRRPLRSSEQNAKLWAMLQDIAQQATWYQKKLNQEQWKALLTAAWRDEETAPGINGGVVSFGVSTSQLNKADFADLIESIYAWGSSVGVEWSEAAADAYYSVMRY